MKRNNTPQENLLLLIALAAEHVHQCRYSYAVTALTVALELARKLAGEEGRCPICKITGELHTTNCPNYVSVNQ